MKKIISLALTITIFILFSCSAFADVDINMGGVDSTVGQSATSNAFKWAGYFAQGIRVTAVNGSSGARLGVSLDYTHYSGKVDVCFDKRNKLNST